MKKKKHIYDGCCKRRSGQPAFPRMHQAISLQLDSGNVLSASRPPPLINEQGGPQVRWAGLTMPSSVLQTYSVTDR